jgi:hypothetical protein
MENLSIFINGMGNQWYKLHVYNCHGSWSILKDQFYFAFFPLSIIIDPRNEVLRFTQNEGETIGAVWSRYKQLAISDSELSILDAMLM